MKRQFAIVLFAVFVLSFVAPQIVKAASPAYSEADYAIAAATGIDPATISTLETATAKTQCAALTPDQCNHSYVTRTNAFAKLLGVPAILDDVGDNVGRLNFAGTLLNAIGYSEYP